MSVYDTTSLLTSNKNDGRQQLGDTGTRRFPS